MCISPNFVKHYNDIKKCYDFYHVPCRHCYECVRQRKLMWELRLSVQHSVSAHTYFGMLTYNDEHLKSEPCTSDIQNYIKRLRYNLNLHYPGATLKYFCVSETGELKDRLHYHILYFVSEEFDDTHLEFQELCKMSWLGKVALSEDEISFRKLLYLKRKKFLPESRRRGLFNWSRQRYDWQSLGFATCQALRGGTCVGSIFYACKYIQKQYNKMYYSKIGYQPWLNYMIQSGQISRNYNEDVSNIEFTSFSSYCYLFRFNGDEYPTFPVRGKRYPVPVSWMLNSVGKLCTTYLRQKLSQQLSQKEKIINYDKVAFHWHKEPERKLFLLHKDSEFLKERALFREYMHFFHNDESLWQTITTRERTLKLPDAQNLTSHFGTLFPPKWD